MQSQSPWGGYGGDDAAPREPGARRKKLAAMAGSVYRAGVAAAEEVREQYNNTRFRNVDTSIDPHMNIPGSFPNVKIVHQGEEQMVLFPSYAKRHVRKFDEHGGSLDQTRQEVASQRDGQAAMNDEEYWHNEWARVEDEKAVVDVDVRGWIYSPHKGPMTRKNRILIGLARRLSGIPPPTIPQDQGDREDLRDLQKIAREAEEIERRGKGEEEVANRGGYSEVPSSRSHSGGATPASHPSSPTLAARAISSAPTMASELTDAELAVANANLMARLGPFLTTPMVQQPITIFFYNEQTSQSRTVMTNDAGHFSIRAALDFVPTNIRVLATENLSATDRVQIIERRGISLISDIDDTIKRSNISLGAREIFRNTFIRDLADMSVPGIKEWYNTLHGMGVQIHYCSNSPWQLFPVLATFFHGAGLPPGSLHLKHYAGMLQGIFEPVAERKKGTLERIMADFPERKFLLVGDSGEADLEVYTDLATANPGRILAIFIRDVTTPEDAAKPGFFDSAPDPTTGPRQRALEATATDCFRSRPVPVTRTRSVPPAPPPPVENLIDFSDDEQTKPASATQSLAGLTFDEKTPESRRTKPPPPRPAKPAALRGSPSLSRESIVLHGANPSRIPADRDDSSAPPLPRRPSPASVHTMSSSRSINFVSGSRHGSEEKTTVEKKPTPPPPRRQGTPLNHLAQSEIQLQRRADLSNNANASWQEKWEILPPPAHPGISRVSTGGTLASSTSMVSNNNYSNNAGMATAVNKRVELWYRRLERAQDLLAQQGVALYTWRRGDDVIAEAAGIVKRAMADIDRGGVERG